MISTPYSRETHLNRRTFYLIFIYAVWALMGLVLAVPAAIYLLWPPRPRKEQDWTEQGTVTQLKLGTPSEFVFRKNRVDGWKVTSEKSTAWVVKMAENQVVAYSPQCPHLGCAVHWVAKHQVFGSVAVFLFLVQAFTGLLLAFNYAPTPGDAYNSLKYIVSELSPRDLDGLIEYLSAMPAQ
jgi:nitrite reductase/ring-hydroxylating ferredoxin subunit